MNWHNSEHRLVPELVSESLKARGLESEPQEINKGHLWALPAAPGSDYFVEVEFEGSGPLIALRLIDRPEKYFWYRWFEIDDYGSVEELKCDFMSFLIAILDYETRVIQKKSWLTYSFALEVRDGGNWRPLGPSVICFRFGGFDAPNPHAKKAIYTSVGAAT